MRFRIYSTSWDRDSDIGRLFKDYPCLNDFGAVIETVYNQIYKRNERRVYIEVDTLERLKELIANIRVAVIIDYESSDEWTIEIYDSYRE